VNGCCWNTCKLVFTITCTHGYLDLYSYQCEPSINWAIWLVTSTKSSGYSSNLGMMSANLTHTWDSRSCSLAFFFQFLIYSFILRPRVVEWVGSARISPPSTTFVTTGRLWTWYRLGSGVWAGVLSAIRRRHMRRGVHQSWDVAETRRYRPNGTVTTNPWRVHRGMNTSGYVPPGSTPESHTHSLTQ